MQPSPWEGVEGWIHRHCIARVRGLFDRLSVALGATSRFRPNLSETADTVRDVLFAIGGLAGPWRRREWERGGGEVGRLRLTLQVGVVEMS